MKFVILILILTASASTGFSQETIHAEDCQYFMILYTVGENWDKSKPAHEQEYFREHSSYLSELRKAQKIEIGARFGETGMILLKADTETEALDVVSRDLAIQNKIFKAEIFSFFPFYKGCIE